MNAINQPTDEHAHVDADYEIYQQLVVPAEHEILIQVMDFIQASAEAIGCSTKRMRYALVVCDEVFSNIVKYAYPSAGGEVRVHFEALRESSSFTVRYIDAGVPFDPFTEDEPDITLALDDRPLGKLGLKVVCDLSRSVEYAYRDGLNILTVEMDKDN